MHQLTALDASFLHMEFANSPMHVAGLSIYDQSTAPGGKVRFKEIIANYARRARPLPTMTRRLVNVPFSLDQPYWVTDGQFDPEFHIRHIALPKPGDWRQLCIQVSRLHARPLDRSRPLWEVYVIEGLDNVEGCPPGSFAIFSKTHHAAVDGTSSVDIVNAIHDLEPDPDLGHEVDMIEVDREPTKLELILKAQMNGIRKPFQSLEILRNSVPKLARTINAVRKGELSVTRDIPRTRFNRKISPHRVFDNATFQLGDVRKIKALVDGATVNDAAVAIVGGGLRKYLTHHDELPDTSLAAMAPVNVRDPKEKGQIGNIVATMVVPVFSTIEDPLERLDAVRDATMESKKLVNSMGAKTMAEYSELMPTMLAHQASRLAMRASLIESINPVFNCVITNVPGPQFPLYNTGAEMLNSYGVGPLVDGLGLFHSIGSYNGLFNISVTCCREMLPDPEFYIQCIRESFEEFRALCKT